VKLHGRPRRDEMGKLMRAFRRMVGALKAGRELETRLRASEKNAMLAVMGAEIAHEIRNPLNFINLSLDHLAAKFTPAGRDAAERAEVENIHTQIKKEISRLTRMTEDYMALARPHALRLTQVSPRRMAGELAFVLASRLAEKNLRVEVAMDESLTLAADADQLRTALLNLLSNAIIAAPEGSAIHFGAAAVAGGALTLTVRDAGPGISDADLPRIFDPYFTTRAEGTGLGLAITKRIVVDHGGEIKVASRAGQGTTFTLVFPPTAASARSDAAPEAAPAERID
jgi:signal transduction histidine kinase